MIFLGFGTMNGKDGGPFKTREGGVMRLEHLIKNIDEKVYEKIQEKQKVSGGRDDTHGGDCRVWRHLNMPIFRTATKSTFSM